MHECVCETCIYEPVCKGSMLPIICEGVNNEACPAANIV